MKLMKVRQENLKERRKQSWKRELTHTMYDLIIIGGGAAAFSAAIKANMLDMKTAMVERGILGGTCINVGCVPSKNLLGAGEILHSSKNPRRCTVTGAH